MSFNGSGTFQINSAGQPVVAGTVITAAAFNALTADLATGLSTCMTKDGQTSATANIPMGNNKFTGLSAGTAATDSTNLGQVQGNVASLISVAGIDTITGSMSPTLTAYTTGAMYWFVAAGTNTGAVTLNIDGLGAKSVTRDGSTALIAGDIVNGQVAVVVYDGTRFQLQKANAFGTLTATTINTTNLTATGTVNLTGATVSNGGSVTTIDINGGTVDGVTIGGASAGAGTFTNLTASGTINFTGATVSNGGSVTTVDINGGTIDGAVIGGASAAAGTFTTATVGAGLVGTPSLTTTGDTNTGLYFPAADTIAATTGGSERMRIDSSGNVGIGTSSPGAKLHINGGTSADQLRLEQGVGFGYKIGRNTSDGLLYFYGQQSGATGYVFDGVNGERMRITSSGDVGIGTASPGAKLEVAGTLTATGNTINFGGNDAINTIINVGGVPTGNKFSITDYIGDTTYTDFGLRVGRVNDGANGTSLLQHRGTGPMILDVFDAGYLVAKTNSTERMRITSSGNVGIGTGSPAQRLHIATAAAPSGTTQTFLRATADLGYGADFGGGIIQGTGAIATISTVDNGTATERMRINSSGNVGIGTSLPTFKFVAANSTTDGVWLYSSGAVSILGLGCYSVATDGAASIRYDRSTGAITFNGGNRDSPSERMRIDNFGNVGIGTSSPNAYGRITSSASATQVSFMSADAGTAGYPAFGFAGQVTANGNRGAGMYLPADNTICFSTLGAERLRLDGSGNVIAGGSVALATNATDGFLYVPTCAGTPTGTPTAITGMAPIVVNTTNNKLYFYSGGAWRDAGP